MTQALQRAVRLAPSSPPLAEGVATCILLAAIGKRPSAGYDAAVLPASSGLMS
jgi:cytochrome c-type biogenesis protein CcmH/NrfG